MTNQSFDTMVSSLSDDVRSYKMGETIKGSIVDLNESRILLELQGGNMGIITKKERLAPSQESFQVGASVEAIVINAENDFGLTVLSLRKASQDMLWAELNTLMNEERIIKVRITEANKGGLMGDYKGFKCFLPVSQLTPVNYPRVDGAEAGLILKKLQAFIGEEFAVRVINVNQDSEKIIISEKAAHQGQMAETLKSLKVGEIVQGTVSGVLKYGIFVTFGGIEGLVHLSELDWGHVSTPSKLYNLGDKVEVMVIGIDGEKLSFSIKRLTEDTWKEKVVPFSPGTKVSGKLIRWNPQGVFIDIADDVQGLFNLTDFGVERYEDLKLKEGDTLTGEVLSVNYDSHRLELKKV